jgi:hypothetical protein
MSEVTAGASRGGAYACLSKPIEVGRLVTVVRQAAARVALLETGLTQYSAGSSSASA